MASEVMTDNLLTRLAAQLREAEATGRPCPPLRDHLQPGDIDSAYAIQTLNAQLGINAGRRVIGRKIGLTSRAVQAQLKVDQPDYGILFADMVVNDEEPIAPGRVLQPRVEAEVALVLDRDLKMDHPTVADVIRATAFVLPAIEVVGSRIQDWNISILDTIADNASCGLIVLGTTPQTVAGLDLRQCDMAMTSRGETVSKGTGAACLGSPLIAAAWLADRMVQAGHPLLAGDLVMTGALGPMVSAKPGDVFEATISGLGSVRAVFQAEGA